MQMLHCIQKAETGGENFIVDAKQAAEYLKSIDYGAFELLTSFPVRFHRKQKNFQSLQVKPIIELKVKMRDDWKNLMIVEW
jgi:hypothetical protein